MTNTKLSAAARLLVIFALIAAPASADTWVKVSSPSFTVMIPKDTEFATIFSNLASRQVDGPRHMDTSNGRTAQLKALVSRIENVFAAVVRLHGKDFEFTGRERVVVLRTREELHKLYKRYYGTSKPRMLAFYSPARKTVYTCAATLSARSLAHELTHMVNDLHYKGSLPLRQNERDAYGMEVNF